MSRALILLPLIALAACGTPQERCINNATSDTRTLQNLLAQVNGNLARGYSYETYEVSDMRWERCGFNTFQGADGRIIQRPRMCLEDYTTTRQRPVPIDPAIETRMRDNLMDKINAQRPQMDAAIAACRAAYPAAQ